MLRAPVPRFVLAPVLVLASAIACAPVGVVLPPSGAARLLVIGDAILPRDPGRQRADAGGISGAFYDARRRQLVAVSDDRTRPRLLTLNLRVAPAVQIGLASVVPLQPPHQGRRTLDLEGIAPAPGGSVFVSSEGDQRDAAQPGPGIYEYRRDGRFVRSMPLPPAYLGSGGEAGMRSNGGLEGLTVSPDGRWLFAAVESGLRQDGPEATFDGGATTRILVYDLHRTEAPPREYAYATEPLQRAPEFNQPTGDTGVSEILSVGEGELLVLERGFVHETVSVGSARTANTIRIFRVRLDGSADVTGRDSLAGAPQPTLRKELLLDAANIAAELSPQLRALENFEGMALGPRLPDGRATLLLLSDDNFNAHQVSAVVVLAFGSNGTRSATTANFQSPTPKALVVGQPARWELEVGRRSFSLGIERARERAR